MPNGPLESPQYRTKAAVALLLTFTAGYIDIVGFLALYQVFTANMTGNTVHFASGLVQSQWAEASLPGLMILSFLSGSVIGRAVIEVGARRRIRRIASLALLIEASLVMLASLAPSPEAKMSIFGIGSLGTLAFAMGLQTATLTRIGPLTIHTTFVTGMLNKLAQLVSHYLFLTYDRWRGKSNLNRATQQVGGEAVFIFSIWLAYFCGAITGTRTENSFGLHALYLPVVLLGIAILVDQFTPLSLREEQEQVEAGS